jgi:hypothetical protein
MTKIQTFTFDSESTILGSWEKLKDYRRKLVAAHADTNGAYKDSSLLLILVRSLSMRFRTTIDTLNAQLNLTVHIVVNKQDKQAVTLPLGLLAYLESSAWFACA